MERIILKNKPLIEAIFELRWKIQSDQIDLPPDPNYKLLVGSMHGRFKDEYPFFEQLPTAQIPDTLAAYLVQYRFRAGETQWPIVQLGPGIITLNETAGYRWDEDFSPRIGKTVREFFASYPGDQQPVVQSLILRYIDAVALDHENQSVFEFLRDKMKIQVELLPSLFEQTGIENQPHILDMRFAFRSDNPPGSISLRFMRGKHNEQDALIWESVFESSSGELPQTESGIMGWADAAHTLIRDWFFKLIEGELQQRFA